MEFSDLIGKTITNAVQKKLADYDDEGFLELTFSDGTDCIVVGNYGGDSGDSEDEYITCISVFGKNEFGKKLIDLPRY